MIRIVAKETAAGVGIIILILAVGFTIGWFAHNQNTSNLKPTLPLRLGGFTFVEPLLACDVSPDKEAPDLAPLKRTVQNIVDRNIAAKKIETASVYFRDLKVGKQFDINPDEKFYPASLRKIPILIALLKGTEAAPEFLSKISVKITGEDQNGQQEIRPIKSARIGQSYTAQELIEKMIIYSDNNAAAALGSLIGEEPLRVVFQNLRIPFMAAGKSNVSSDHDLDFISPHEFSFFFRVLYNATYINRYLSEQALKLLSEVDYKNGLVAGVPPNVVVSHKFGLTTIKDKNGGIISRELHDCGIVYRDDKPYVLCVMTKSRSAIPEIEQVIKDISTAVYQEVSAK